MRRPGRPVKSGAEGDLGQPEQKVGGNDPTGHAVTEGWLPLAVAPFAVRPLIDLYASNTHRGVSADQLVGWVPVALLYAAGVWLVCRRLLHRPGQAVVAAIAAVFWTFSGRWQSVPLIVALAVALSLGLALLAGRVPDQRRIAGFLGMLGVVVLGAASWPAVRYHRWERAAPTAFPALEVSLRPIDPLPDVYYFVLDGLARPDVQAHIGVPADPAFLEGLARRGFDVSADSRSNYAQTLLSVASILALHPLDALEPALDPSRTDRLVLMDTVRESRLTALFAQAGYRVATSRSEVSFLPTVPADVHLGPLPHLDDFDHFVLNETVFPWLADLFRPSGAAHLQDRLHRRAVDGTLAATAALAPDPTRPTFAFVHVVSPHPPFVFGENGEQVPRPLPFHISDGSNWARRPRHVPGTYAEQYAAQTRWLEGRMIEVIDRILARGRPTILVLQGDHGTAVNVDLYGGGQPSDLFERFGAFQAWRWHDGLPASAPDTVTPVNGVRVLANEVLGTQLPPVPDTSWFSDWPAPYALRDVTAEAVTPPPAPAPPR